MTYFLQLASYGGQLHYTIKFSIDTSAPWQYHLAEADVVLQVIISLPLYVDYIRLVTLLIQWSVTLHNKVFYRHKCTVAVPSG